MATNDDQAMKMGLEGMIKTLETRINKREKELGKDNLEQWKQSSDPELKKKAEEIEAALKDDRNLIGYRRDIEGFIESIRKLEGEPIIKQEEEMQLPSIEVNGTAAQLPSLEAGTAAQPIDVDELDLLKPKSQRALLNAPRRILVAKTGPRGKRIAIVQYGPPYAATYRREDVTEEDVEGVPDISDPGERPGQKGKYIGGKFKFDRTKKDVMAVQGVAFKDTGYSEPIEELNPDTKGDGTRFPPTDVLIKWNVNGEISTSWETRTVFRRLWWNNKKGAADKDLYLAAQVSQERFKEWEEGKRMGSDRSPTPIPEITARIRARSLQPTPGLLAASSPPQDQSLLVNNNSLSIAPQNSLRIEPLKLEPLKETQMPEWIQGMCEMLGRSFDTMSMAEKGQLIHLWIQQTRKS